MQAGSDPDSLGIAFWATVVVTAVGWLAAFRLGALAQRSNLQHQILDRARGEITPAIRDFQSILSSYVAAIASLQLAIRSDWHRHTDVIPSSVLRLEHIAREHTLPRLDWVLQLEEYEILFPETRDVRHQLVAKQSALFERVSVLLNPIDFARTLKEKQEADRALAELASLHMAFLDQSALMEDMRVHLQNAALGRITGTAIPGRLPKAGGRPFLTSRSKGRLEISVSSGVSVPDHVGPLSLDDDMNGSTGA